MKLFPDKLFQKFCYQGSPGGSVVKNLPTSAEDTGSIHDLGRSHMLWSN